MAVGIIAEYNPFHNGHKLHIEKTKSMTQKPVVALISGNYVQRGEPAITDKWSRTMMALDGGADLVLELPTIFATGSAELFAYSSVNILENTGIIEEISFGSECGDVEVLSKIANLLSAETPLYKELLKKHLDTGLVYPKARENAVSEIMPEANQVLNNPNNILGIEYIKAINKLKSSINVMTISREKTGYHELSLNENISSATGIRNSIKNNDMDFLKSSMPALAFEILSGNIKKGVSPVYFDDFSRDLNYKLRMSTKSEIASILDVTEGLENRIYQASKEFLPISHLCDLIKTKRYTSTKIQRAILHIILNIKKQDPINSVPYIRVLGFRKSQSHVLSNLMKNSNVPVITNINKLPLDLSPSGREILLKECMYTDLYFSHCKNPQFSQTGQEYTRQIVIF